MQSEMLLSHKAFPARANINTMANGCGSCYALYRVSSPRASQTPSSQPRNPNSPASWRSCAGGLRNAWWGKWSFQYLGVIDMCLLHFSHTGIGDKVLCPHLGHLNTGSPSIGGITIQSFFPFIHFPSSSCTASVISTIFRHIGQVALCLLLPM